MHNVQAKSRTVKNSLISLEETAKYRPGLSFGFAVKSTSHAQVWGLLWNFSHKVKGAEEAFQKQLQVPSGLYQNA